jgi:LmbE family N-acetylglucosaminyl deacetylase
MSTLVCFHAHPDDESIATGGTIAKAVAEGHRVVLVLATRGEHGEVAEGFLAPGEQLGLRRIDETLVSARMLGVHRVEFLGYVDSGMIGTPENEFPYCFWKADVEQAANRLAAILREEQADAITVYDNNGGYGHPDHIQVHRVGIRAAELAGTARIYESTMNRTAIIESMSTASELFTEEERAAMPDLDETTFGVLAEEITHAIDVSEFLELKRESIRCHASQVSEEDFFLKMAPDAFAQAFGTEWFIEHGTKRAPEAPFQPLLELG